MIWKRQGPPKTQRSRPLRDPEAIAPDMAAAQRLHGLLVGQRIEVAADLFVAAFSTGGPERVRIEELAVLLLRQVGAEPRAAHLSLAPRLEPNGTAARLALEILWLWERAGIAKLYPTEANIVFPLLRGNRALSSRSPLTTLRETLAFHDLPVPEVATSH